MSLGFLHLSKPTTHAYPRNEGSTHDQNLSPCLSITPWLDTLPQYQLKTAIITGSGPDKGTADGQCNIKWHINWRSIQSEKKKKKPK
jgi:hypothetical protein